MTNSVAIKLAAYLAHVAAHARVKRAADSLDMAHAPVTRGLRELTGVIEKQANPASPPANQTPTKTLSQRFGDNPLPFMTAGGAGLGALLGGGSTAVANVFRNKRDRKSVLNSALLGGLGGGALGFGGSAIYQGLNSPDNIKKKLIVNEDVEAARNKILNADPAKRKAYEDAQDPLRAAIVNNTGIDISGTDAKLLASGAGALAGGKLGAKYYDNPRLLQQYITDPKLQQSPVKAEMDRVLGSNPSLREQQRFAAEAGRRGSSTPGLSTLSRALRRSPDSATYRTAGNPTGTQYNPQTLVAAARQERGWSAPRAGTYAGIVGGAAVPWLAEPAAQLLGYDPLSRMQGRQTLADIDLQAEQLARKEKGR